MYHVWLLIMQEIFGTTLENIYDFYWYLLILWIQNYIQNTMIMTHTLWLSISKIIHSGSEFVNADLSQSIKVAS